MLSANAEQRLCAGTPASGIEVGHDALTVAMEYVVAIFVSHLGIADAADGVMGGEPGQVGTEENALGAAFAHEAIEDAAVVENGGQFEVDVGEVLHELDCLIPAAVTGMSHDDGNVGITLGNGTDVVWAVEAAAAPGVTEGQQVIVVEVLPVRGKALVLQRDFVIVTEELAADVGAAIGFQCTLLI